MKLALVLIGLFADLVGAFLLSIPLLWDAKTASRKIFSKVNKFKRRFISANTYAVAQNQLDNGSYGKVIIARNPASLVILEEARTRLLSVLAGFLLGFVVIAGRLVAVAEPDWSIPNWIAESKTPTPTFEFGILGAVVPLLTFLLVRYFSKIPLCLGRSMYSIAKRKHERRIGVIGLAILCLGFVLQGIVNLIE